MTEFLSLPLLSECVPGGIAYGANYLVEFEAESLWYEASLTLAAQALRMGIKTDYHTFTRLPADIRKRLTALGLNLEELEANDTFRIWDSYTIQTGAGEPEKLGKLSPRDPIDLHSVNLDDWTREDIRNALKEAPEVDKRRLHIDDDTSVLLQFNDEKKFLFHWRTQTIPFARRNELCMFHTVLVNIHSDSFYRQLESFCDGILDFKTEDQGKELIHYSRVRVMRGAACDSKWRRMTVLRTGEVSFQLPMPKPVVAKLERDTITPERWKRLKELFDAALQRGPASRVSFLAQAALDEPSLADEVLGLLDSDEKANAFLSASVSPGFASTTFIGVGANAGRSDAFIGRVLTHYRLDEPLGGGGMGVVYRATDLKLGRAVAIKLLSRQLAADETAKARFLREARAASALDHPNIGVIHEVGEQDGELFIAMALYQGETLKQRLERGALPLAEGLTVVRELALGLEAAHRAGIVHRDIKPANVMLSSTGSVKILDFGLAKLASEVAGQTLTQTGQAFGTLLYMSPEQLKGQAADARSDLWSLGVVAHELFSGVCPFKTESNAATAARIFHEEPPSLTNVPGVPSWLAELVTQLLRKNPSERPQTATEVLRSLEAGPTAPMRRRSLRQWFSELKGRLVGARLILILVVIGVLAAAPGLGWYFLLRGGARTSRPADGKDRGAAARNSIAVLPFADLSPGKDQEYFADGLAEELLDLLAKVPGLHVAARTSAFSFKGKVVDVRTMAEKLQVATLLEGSVRKSGDQLRITTQLINAADGYHLWSETYNRKLTDVFAVQDEIAQSVVAALKLKLLPEQSPTSKEHRTSNPEVYTQYLLGRQFMYRSTLDGYRRAEQAFQKAISMDPGFAPAWAGLAGATYWIADSGETPADVAEGQARAMAAAEKSIALAPDLAEAYVARGALRSAVRWDWTGARADFERAIALSPESGDVWREYANLVLRPLGLLQEAIAAAQKSSELDPLYGRAWGMLGSVLLCAGQFEAARKALERSLEVNPEQAFAGPWLGRLFLLQKRPELALAEVQRSTSEILRLAGAAVVHQELGHAKESQQALDELIVKYAHAGAYQIGGVYAWRGDTDRAFQWLERAYAQADGGLMSIKTDPFLANLRTDPRYLALLRKMNLPLD